MKRGLLGAALLAVLIFGGSFLCRHLDRRLVPLQSVLQQASLAAQAGDWQQAQVLVEEAGSQWEACRCAAAAFSDHGPLEQIDRLLSRLEVWNRAKDPVCCTDLCVQLIRELEALVQADSLTWENFL